MKHDLGPMIVHALLPPTPDTEAGPCFLLRSSPRVIVAALLSFLTVSTASAQLDTLWYGHRAFADGRYDDAMTAYQAAIDQGSSWTWLPDLITTVQARKDLGTIAPADTHVVRFIYVTTLHQMSDSGTTTQSDVTQEQRDMWAIYFEVFRQTIESFSGGAWTVRYDTVSATSTYRVGSPLAPDNPDHLDLESDFFGSMPETDTYITLSNTRSPSRGLARTYPYINGVLYGPDRGMAAINAATSGYGGLLHEFFHTVEWVSDAIGMAHGYTAENRANFPGWTGSTEFDYYRWHFAETLPRVPWRRMNHRTRWIPVNADPASITTLRSVYAGITFDARKDADTLTASGKALYATDPLAAVSLFEQALALSPYHPEALGLLHDHYRFASTNIVRRAELLARLRTVRAATDYATIDTVNAGHGQVAGFWHPEDTPASWEQRSWDISPSVSPGDSCYVTFYYTRGWKAIDIDSVALFRDGSEISRDDHRGFSGNVKTDNVYALGLGSYDPQATYEVRASVKGSGGVDSYGQIHVRIASLPTTVGKRGAVPGVYELAQNYPNPFNPVTHIRFTMPAPSRARLTIRDILGRVVSVLFDDEYDAGSHVLSWKTDRYASGVYLYTLEVFEGNTMRRAMTRRMILIR